MKPAFEKPFPRIESIEDINIQAELAILSAMKSEIKGLPGCHRRGCDGTGVLGITVVTNDKGKRKAKLLTCSCAQFGETEYVRLSEQIRSLALQNRNLSLALEKEIQAINENMVNLYRHTPSGFVISNLLTLWDSIRRLLRKAIKKESK